jgi:hypothetical protein
MFEKRDWQQKNKAFHFREGGNQETLVTVGFKLGFIYYSFAIFELIV